MGEIKIRNASLKDHDTLLAFEQGIIMAERPFDQTLKEGIIHYYDLAHLIQSENAHVVVALSNQEVVGSGFARIDPSKPYLKHDRHAYLGFMYVKPEYRGKGINQQITEALSKWASEKGIKELRLEVYADNHPAIRAYEKAGFTKNLVEMRMQIK